MLDWKDTMQQNKLLCSTFDMQGTWNDCTHRLKETLLNGKNESTLPINKPCYTVYRKSQVY